MEWGRRKYLDTRTAQTNHNVDFYFSTGTYILSTMQAYNRIFYNCSSSNDLQKVQGVILQLMFTVGCNSTLESSDILSQPEPGDINLHDYIANGTVLEVQQFPWKTSNTQTVWGSIATYHEHTTMRRWSKIEDESPLCLDLQTNVALGPVIAWSVKQGTNQIPLHWPSGMMPMTCCTHNPTMTIPIVTMLTPRLLKSSYFPKYCSRSYTANA